VSTIRISLPAPGRPQRMWRYSVTCADDRRCRSSQCA